MPYGRIAIYAALLTFTGLAAARANTLNVHVISEAGTRVKGLDRAERLASDMLQNAGIHVRWVAGPVTPGADPRTFILVRILDRLPRARLALESAAPLGFSLVGTTAKHAAVFREEVERTAFASSVPEPIVLGCAIAHEIGHLLTDSTRHSPTGLMRAVLRAADLKMATQGRLKFSTAEAIAMQDNLRSAGTEAFALDRVPTRATDSPSTRRFDPTSIP